MKDLIQKHKNILIGEVFRMKEKVVINDQECWIVNPAIFSGAGPAKILFRCNAPGGFSTEAEAGKFWVAYDNITPELTEEIFRVLRENGVDTKAEQLLGTDLKREVTVA